MEGQSEAYGHEEPIIRKSIIGHTSVYHDQSLDSVTEGNTVNIDLSTIPAIGPGEVVTTTPTDTVVRNNKRKLEDPHGLTHDAAQEYVSDYDEEEIEEYEDTMSATEFEDAVETDTETAPATSAQLSSAAAAVGHEYEKRLTMESNQELLDKIQNLTDAMTKQAEEHNKRMQDLQDQLARLISLMTEKDEELSRLRRQIESDKQMAQTRIAEAVERDRDLAAAAAKKSTNHPVQNKPKKTKGPAGLLDNSTSGSVPTQNRFNTLDDEDSESMVVDLPETTNGATGQAATAQPPPPPQPQAGPSGIQKKKATVGDKLPKEKQPDNLYFKYDVKKLEENLDQIPGVKGNYYSSGISNNSSTARGANEHINKLITEHLDATNPDYHVHPKKGEVPLKVALYKLGGFQPAEVIDMLNNCQELMVKPTEVVIMKKFNHVTNERVNTSNFTVTFPAGTKLADLKKIHHLDHRAIKFDRLNKSKRPPYCTKCQSDGHVRWGCKHQVICGKCGQQHETNECPKFDKNALAKDMFCYRCAATGHPAFYTKCPHRKRFFDSIERQKKAREMKQRSLAEPMDNNRPTAKLSANKMRSLAHVIKYTTPAPVQQAVTTGAWTSAPQLQHQQPNPEMRDFMAFLAEQNKDQNIRSQQNLLAIQSLADSLTSAIQALVNIQPRSDGGN